MIINKSKKKQNFKLKIKNREIILIATIFNNSQNILQLKQKDRNKNKKFFSYNTFNNFLLITINL